MHRYQSAGCSSWTASACDETSQLHRVELAILAGLRIGEQASESTPICVLCVYKQGEPQGHRHDLALLRRQKNNLAIGSGIAEWMTRESELRIAHIDGNDNMTDQRVGQSRLNKGLKIV